MGIKKFSKLAFALKLAETKRSLKPIFSVVKFTIYSLFYCNKDTKPGLYVQHYAHIILFKRQIDIVTR